MAGDRPGEGSDVLGVVVAMVRERGLNKDGLFGKGSVGDDELMDVDTDGSGVDVDVSTVGRLDHKDVSEGVAGVHFNFDGASFWLLV